MIDLDKLEAMAKAHRAGQQFIEPGTATAARIAAYVCGYCGMSALCECASELADAAPALLAEIKRLRAIKAAAEAYVDLTPDRVDYVPLLFAKLQAAVAAKEEA